MLRLALFCILIIKTLSAQDKINFVELGLQAALDKAKAENKMVFVDAYASYCLPCKQMDIEFKNPSLIKYFNDNFINIKVDMEGDLSHDYKNDYQIVFLPSLIFIEASGKQRTKIDNIVSSNELLSIGKYINDKYGNLSAHDIAFEKTQDAKATIIHPTPFGAFPPTQKISQSSPPKPDNKEKIVYVMGQEDQDLPPHLLKEEAYFRMQFMDGSHFQCAHKYLETQENWMSEENIKFIFDFIPDCHSPLFEHVVANKSQYDSALGKERVDKTIGILVKRELDRAYPRPNKERALYLYSLLNRKNAPKLAEQYYLETQFLKKNYSVFFSEGLTFIEKEKIKDTQFIFNICQASLLTTVNKKDQKKSIRLLDALLNQNPNNENYYYTLSQMHLKLNDKKKALSSIQRAVDLLKSKNITSEKITSLHSFLSTS